MNDHSRSDTDSETAALDRAVLDVLLHTSHPWTETEITRALSVPGDIPVALALLQKDMMSAATDATPPLSRQSLTDADAMRGSRQSLTRTEPPVNTARYAAKPSQAADGQQGIADFYVTIVCVGVGELWRSQFPACVQAGVWPSAPDIVHRQRWLPRLAHVQAGQLGLAVHGFRWRNPEQPPRNRHGSAYHSRAPLPIFRANAVFAELVIYRVTGTPYETSRPVPGIDPRFSVHITPACK